MTFHTAPIFCCRNRKVLDRFLHRYRIVRDGDPESVIEQCADAFSQIPYENLTKIIKSDAVVSPDSALRFPEEVIAEHLEWGTGGTCFSLTAALIAVFNELGFEAQPLLADRHYGANTHCGLVVKHQSQTLLIDPGFLLFKPTPLPSASISFVDLGHTGIELRPVEVENGSRIELATVSGGARKLRLTYKRSPVDTATFKRAWVDSFTWEMMTYPVITRSTASQHLYLQGSSAMVRTHEKTTRSKLEAPQQLAFIERYIGISRSIIFKAWEVTHHGKH